MKMTNIVENERPRYDVLNYILFFFIFSFCGWIWEVLLHLIDNGQLVNRGVLIGPWLPIYGTGGIVAIIFLKKLYNKPVSTFFLSMLICSIIEYFTSWYLEVTKGLRWWDYSGYFLNINGRICLIGSIAFGLICCFVIYILAPKLDCILNRFNAIIKIILCITLISLFSFDMIHSKFYPNVGKGVTDYEYKKKSQV